MTDEFDKTIASPVSQVATTPVPLHRAVNDTRRATVLPRLAWKGDQPEINPSTRERYEELGRLGQGGMGEVVLIKDHDIERTVALKRLPAESDLGLVLRFAEEVRAVGQLEHPNIVPVHDVGIDDRGRYFFMMKHLQGDTLESIVTRLRAGDPQTLAKYPFPVRVQIFLGVLHALAYAHKQGFIHRDLKPANIMIGPFGEVTVMDWGLAKRIRAPEGQQPELPGVPRETASARDTTTVSQRAGSALATLAGSVMGTPLFMSPEQARGEHDSLDERSDTYALGAIFYELILLEHYLAHVEHGELQQILEAVKTYPAAGGVRAPVHRAQPLAPAELVWYAVKALEKDKAKRFQSVAEMERELQQIVDGRIHIQCPRTFMKWIANGTSRAIDSHPIVSMVFGPIAVVAVLASLVTSALALLR